MNSRGERRAKRIRLARLSPRLFTACLLILAASAGNAEHPRRNGTSDGAEVQIKLIFEKIQKKQIDTALQEIDRLIDRHPNFRLAHLVRGDLLLARARPINALGNTAHGESDRLEELRAEAVTRLRAYGSHPPANLIPRYLLWLSPLQRNVVVVDAGRSRVYVYENAGGTPRLVEDYYTTLGKYGFGKNLEGDKKTPIGVYHITSKIPGAKLPDLYGWGAFPINYPNEWDRRLGKTGYGIWLHGVPSDTYARAPWASDGCIALANPDIENLGNSVQPGVTPVIISERVEWMTPTAWRAERDTFMMALQTWRADWESLDTEKYLAHYAPGFSAGGMDIAGWREHKGRVNVTKTWVKVALENVSVFRSPGKQELIVVTFDQDYRSNNLAQRTRKRQYWVVEDGRWKIGYEGPARAAGKLALPESFPGKS